MKVELLYFNGCPNYKVLLLRLRGFLQREGIEAELELKRVETPEEAVRLGFIGSPRVRVDGHDIEIEATERRDFSLECRLYRTPDGLSGMPPDGMLLAALCPIR
jgi:hypothetical protein